MEIFHDPNYNCKTLQLTASMKRNGISIDGLWKKIGFHYNPSFKGKISPYQLNLEENLHSFGFELRDLNYNNSEAFLSTIHSLLEGNVIIGVDLDVYNLPYSLYYQELHQKHSIEIFDFDDENFFICDHYYKYKGSISRSAFINAINETLENFNTLHIFYLEKIKEIENESVYTIINENLNALEGMKVYPEETPLSKTGIQSIPIFRDALISELSSNKSDEEMAEIISSYYSTIKELSFSRYHLHKYIHILDKEIAVRILDASQHWSIIAHLLLMSSVSKKYNETTLRVQKAFDKVFEKEKVYVSHLKALSLEYANNH